MLTPTLRPKTCAYSKCGREFIPFRPMQQVCGPVCASRLVRSAAAEKKAKEKAERALDRAKREGMKPRRKWLAEAQAAVNKYVRLRDMRAGCGCISCGATPSQKFGGTMDAGHFRSVGSAPHMRYYLPQIAMQCVRCNRHLGGNAVEFRRGLIERRGLERVEAIEAMQGVAKWPIDYLQRLTRIMSKKARRVEKRMETTA